MGCLYQTPPLNIQGSIGARRQKDRKSRRWWMIPRMFSRNTRAEAHAHLQRLWQHMQCSSQTGSQHGEVEVDTKFSRQEAICNCYLLGKGLRFHQLNITSDINSPEQATGPKVVGKHKPDSTAGFVVLCCACRQDCILCLCTHSCTFFCLW